MMPPMKHLPLIATLTLLALAPLARAQTGAALMIQPWRGDTLVELRGGALIMGDGSSENGTDVDLTFYGSTGRARLGADAPLPMAFGYDLIYIDIGGNDPRLPDRMTDQSLGVGATVGEWSGWKFDVTAGVGYASDAVYNDGDGWYGKAAVVGTTKLDENTTLRIAVDWDGNRLLLPDLPLPFVQYQRVESEQFMWSVGFPYSSIRWKPIDKLTIEAFYLLPIDARATVTYDLLEQLSLFASFYNEAGRFHISDSRENDYHMFRQRRLEGGLTWKPCEYVDFTFAGGYAFEQIFSRGYHVLNDTDRFHLDDQAYIRVGVSARF